MVPALSRKSVLFLCLGVFVLLFGIVGEVSAKTCSSETGWEKTDFSCSINYSDFGGSDLKTCEYKLKNTQSGYDTGWLPVPAASCSGSGQVFTWTITVGATSNCRDSGGVTCKLYAKATDNAGLIFETPEASPINSFDIDYQPPLVSANNASSEWFQSRTVTISASDAGSNISRSRYSWDTNPMGDTCLDAGNPFSVPTATITVPAGSHWLYFCATDNAGNPKAENAGPYKVDPTAPAVTSLTINGNSCSGESGPNNCNNQIVVNSTFTIAWAVSDSGGSYLDNAKIYKAEFVNGSCDNNNKSGCSWGQVGSTIPAPANVNSWATSATDSPLDNTYWYGIHIADKAGSCIKEDTGGTDKGHCGGVSGDSLDNPVRTDRGPIKVKMQRNQQPVAVDDSYVANEDVTLTKNAWEGVLANDTNANGNPLTAIKVTDPSHGTLTFNANGSFVYTPNINYNGVDSFTYKANYGTTDSNIATVTIAVNAVNDAPSFTKGANQTVLENAGAQAIAGWATSISPGPANESGQIVNFIVSNNNNGLFLIQPVISASGTLSYTPVANASGSAVVTVQIHDDGGTASNGVDTSAAQTFTITVADGTAPTITSFTINGIPCSGSPCTATITANTAIGIAWFSTDAGGSGIQKHEVWRAPDSGGSPGAWTCIIGIGCPMDRDANPAGESDNPAGGTYWYGIHTFDNVSNCISEDTTGVAKGHCGGVASDSLDTRADKGPIKVVMDKTPPILAQVTAVPSPTDDTTPNYTFSSTESGAITYGGDCSSATSTASMGNNTVTFGWLTQGTHSNCTIRVTDAAGNPSNILGVNSFTISTIVPPNDTTASLAVSKSGTGTGTVTSSPAGINCGSTCSALYASGTAVDLTASADAGSAFASWSGCNSMSGAICTVVMSTTKTATVTFNDGTAPTVTSFTINGASCTGGACPATVTAKAALNMAWTASDNVGGSGVKRFEVWRAIDNAGTPNWNNPGNGQANPIYQDSTATSTADNPPDGTYWYGIHAIDNANNCITEATTFCPGGVTSDGQTRTVRGPIKVVMDKTSPVAPSTPNLVAASDSGSSNTDNITNDNAPTFTGTAEVGSTVKLYSDSVQVGTGVGGSYNITASSLANGTHNIKATATDAANNTSGDSGYLSVTIDTVVPQKPTCSPAGGTFQNKANNVTCSAEPGATIRYTLDGSSPILSSTLYSSPFDIASSAMLTVAAWDISGNRSATPDISYSFTILNNQAPSIQGSPSDSPDPIKANAPITFSVTWSDPDAGDLIKIHICKTDAISGQTQTCSGGSWCDSSAFSSVSPTLCNGTSPASSGSQNYFAFACDDENACSSSNSGTFLVDTQAPIITTFTITPQSPSWANNASPSITVTWNVSDQGGSHLDRVRVYRAPFGAGCNDADKSNCSWVQAGSDAIAPNNSDNWNCGATCNDRIVDNPGSGTWWYGMHVLDKAQNETTESPLPGAKKALVDTINPSTAVTFPPAGTWFKDNFNATLDDSDTGGSGLATGASGCQYRFIGDNPSGQDTSSGDLTRQCDPVTKAITVGPSPDVCRYEGIGRCRVESKSFDAAGNTSGWQTMLFGVDFTTPIIGSPAPSSAQSGVSTTYSATLRDPIGKVTGCGFYWRAVGSGTWNTGAATIIDPIPCENDANCTVSVDHMFASAGSYETQFGCTDQATNTGWGGVTTVEVGSLSVGLNAVPSSGSINTLFDLVATVSGTMTGNINYKFDCTNDGAWELEVNNQTQNPYTAIDLCQYSSPNTYTAKVFAQRGVGAAEDTVSIPISSNSIPTTTNRSVDAPNPVDYCGVTGYPPVRVRWTFSDADQEDTQGAYQIQIFHGGDMVVDTGKKSGATQSYVFQSAGEQLLWNRTYTWQVRVWDSPNDDVSAFASGPQFTTPQHYYPTPNFSWSPALPSVQESVQFTDQTNFATGSTNKTWSWTFGDSGSSAAQNPAHSYLQTGAFGATLESSDNVGSCSVQKTVNISIPFPEWQEISPF